MGWGHMVCERWVLSLSVEAGCERGEGISGATRDGILYDDTGLVSSVRSEQGTAIVYKRGQRTFKNGEGLVQLCAKGLVWTGVTRDRA